MQEVIVKTIVILAALLAIVLIFNRFGRKNKGCGCGCGCDCDSGNSSACGECPQAADRQTDPKTSSKNTSES